MHILFFQKMLIILRWSTKHANFWLRVQFPLNCFISTKSAGLFTIPTVSENGTCSWARGGGYSHFCPLNYMWYKKSSWLVKRIFPIARCLCWQLVKVSDEKGSCSFNMVKLTANQRYCLIGMLDARMQIHDNIDPNWAIEVCKWSVKITICLFPYIGKSKELNYVRKSAHEMISGSNNPP